MRMDIVRTVATTGVYLRAVGVQGIVSIVMAEEPRAFMTCDTAEFRYTDEARAFAARIIAVADAVDAELSKGVE